MSKICFLWVASSLTEDQNTRRVKRCREMLKIFSCYVLGVRCRGMDKLLWCADLVSEQSLGLWRKGYTRHCQQITIVKKKENERYIKDTEDSYISACLKSSNFFQTYDQIQERSLSYFIMMMHLLTVQKSAQNIWPLQD